MPPRLLPPSRTGLAFLARPIPLLAVEGVHALAAVSDTTVCSWAREEVTTGSEQIFPHDATAGSTETASETG